MIFTFFVFSAFRVLDCRPPLPLGKTCFFMFLLILVKGGYCSFYSFWRRILALRDFSWKSLFFVSLVYRGSIYLCRKSFIFIFRKSVFEQKRPLPLPFFCGAWFVHESACFFHWRVCRKTDCSIFDPQPLGSLKTVLPHKVFLGEVQAQKCHFGQNGLFGIFGPSLSSRAERWDLFDRSL